LISGWAHIGYRFPDLHWNDLVIGAYDIIFRQETF
jgi:hypothetical protein